MALALAMGIGRFAYTALLPAAQAGLGFDDATAGAIASVNLVGYLLGALQARALSGARARGITARLGLALSVATTAALAFAGSAPAWLALRLLSGVASGYVFVLVSATVLEAIPPGAERLAGLLYSGVGAGIALSGAVAAALPGAGGREAWLVLGGTAAGLALLPGWLLRPSGSARAAPPPPADAGAEMRRLSISYFLEGLGYIVSGTFAVAAVQRSPGLEGLAPWVWVAAGLAAIPSALVWSAMARRVGARRALVWAFALQGAGMAVSGAFSSLAAALVGALLFGGTFMGITTVTLARAREIDPARGARTIGTLTVLYGVGQVLGPLLAGALSRAAGSPRPAVVAASLAVMAGALLLAREARCRTSTSA
jgi:MFS family permease